MSGLAVHNPDVPLPYLKINLRGVLHNPLDVHLDKLVERVELLPDETLLLEVRGDHDPAGLGWSGGQVWADTRLMF